MAAESAKSRESVEEPQGNLLDRYVPWLVSVALIPIGAALIWRGILKGRRVAYLRAHGLSLAARVLETTATAWKIGHVPVYRLRLLVAGPAGPYEVSVDKALHANEVQTIVGRNIGLRVHPERPTDVMLED